MTLSMFKTCLSKSAVCAAAGVDSIEVNAGDILQTGVKVRKKDSYYRVFSIQFAQAVSIPLIDD